MRPRRALQPVAPMPLAVKDLPPTINPSCLTHGIMPSPSLYRRFPNNQSPPTRAGVETPRAPVRLPPPPSPQGSKFFAGPGVTIRRRGHGPS